MVKINRTMIIGIIFGLIIIASSSVFFYLDKMDSKLFSFLVSIAAVIIAIPFFINLLVESNKEKSKDQMFLEFSRDLVEGVKAGTPISKSIINVRFKDYGSLSPYVIKLANQIELGIPVKDAFEIFSKEVKSPVISRSVSLIREAERSGGRIEAILESVSYSVSQIEKLKKERKAVIYNLTVQGYIIFLIFIIIMLIMQFKILPITSELGTGASNPLDMNFGSSSMDMSKKIDVESVSNSFLFLLITQGFFAGLIIGKISEGDIKSGLKHSFILVALSLLIVLGARVFFGG